MTTELDYYVSASLSQTESDHNIDLFVPARIQLSHLKD